MRLAEQTEHIGFRTSPEHARGLREVAAERGISVSVLLREAVEILVEDIEPDRRPTLDQISSSNPFIARAARRRR